MTDEDLVKNLAWYREEAGLESAYPVTHPMSMFVKAIAARERLKKREWVGLTETEVDECYESVMFNPDIEPTRVLVYQAIEAKLKQNNFKA